MAEWTVRFYQLKSKMFMADFLKGMYHFIVSLLSKSIIYVSFVIYIYIMNFH